MNKIKKQEADIQKPMLPVPREVPWPSMILSEDLVKLRAIYDRMNQKTLANIQLPKLTAWTIFKTHYTEIATVIEKILNV